MKSKNVVTTELQLARLSARESPYDVVVGNTPGLCVRITRKQKTFRWDRGRGYKPRIITYGSFPQLSLREARERHAEAQARHKEGMDPRTSGGVNDTVAELAEQFYATRIVGLRKRPEDVRRTLDTDIIPKLGRRRLSAVATPEISEMVRDVVQRGAPVHAGKVLAHTKQMFRFACSVGLIVTSPADPLDPDNLGVENNKRDRVLTGDEIRLLYEALDRAPKMSLQVKTAIRLLLLTGLRSGELRQATWSAFDPDTAVLTIPVSNQKLSRKQEKRAQPFACPLPRQAIDLLRELRQLDDTWVIPGRSDGTGPVTDHVFGRAVRRLLALKDERGERILPIPPFSPHDLRRTCRSGLSALGVPPHIAERCLNHSLGRIADIYDRHDYLEERREALQRWADQVDLYTRGQMPITRHHNRRNV